MKTQAAIQEFLLSRGGLRPKSLEAYRWDLALFQHAFPDELPITPQPIQAFFNSQHRVRGKGDLTKETVHRRFRSVRAMYRQVWSWHQNELKDTPNPIPLVRVPRPKPEEKPHRFWTHQEIYALFLLDLSLRDRTLLMLFCDVGPRADECLKLVWDDIVPGFVTFRGKSGTRTVPLSDATFNMLQKLKESYGKNAGKYVFKSRVAEHLTYQGLYHLVQRLCRRAGITGRQLSPHTWRHSFGTYYAAADACEPKMLQAIMGHKDYGTTLGYIQHNPILMARNHAACTPLKDVATLAQGNLFEPRIVKEAEEILAKKGDK